MPITSYNYSPTRYPHWNFDSVVVVEGQHVVLANIARVRRALRETNKAFVLRKAAELYHTTTGIVPYLSGQLYSAAFIKSVSGSYSYPIQAVGYDTGIAPYAVFVHEWTGQEHPTQPYAPRQEPKQDHFLSEPRDAMAKTFEAELTRELVGAIRRMRSISGAQKGGIVTAIRSQR